MASKDRQRLSDLLSYSIVVFLLIGFIIEDSYSDSSDSCSAKEAHFRSDRSCQQCFTGICCNVEANRQPKFFADYDDVMLSSELFSSDQPIYTAVATDDDRLDACDGSSDESCPCADVNYRLDGWSDVFTINPETGDIFVVDSSNLTPGVYTVRVHAENMDKSGETSMKLDIKYRTNYDNERYHVGTNNGYDDQTLHKREPSHRRVKRATENPPTNVTFNLIKKDPHASKTDMIVGQEICFELTIKFPTGETDMLVELFTPDNETVIMMLCGVNVSSTGTNLVITGNPMPEFHSMGNNLYYDRAVINFGNVTNSGATSNGGDHDIVIDYCAVMLDTLASTKNGSIFWVSAGAEYNNEQDVWVGQASFTGLVDNDETFSKAPSVNFAGPSTMAIGSSAIFTVDMFIPYPAVTLSFDAFAPLNTSDVMSICAVSGKEAAVNYDCGFDITKLSSQAFADGNIKGNARMQLDMGRVINKGMRNAGNTDADNKITVQFVAQLYDNPAFVGQKFWVGGALEIGNDQIWAGQTEVEAILKSTTTPTSITFTLPTTNGEKTSTSRPVKIEAEIGVPQSSTYEYRLEVVSAKDASSDPYFQICNIRLYFAGHHIPCADTNIQATYNISKPGGSVYDEGVLDLNSVTNVGTWGHQASGADADKLKIEVLVKATGAVTTGSQKVTVALHSGTVLIQTHDVNVDIEAAGAAGDVVNSSMPTMAMSFKSGSDNAYIGGATNVVLEITTARDVLLPVMDIEFIMPNDSSNDGISPITICRTEITFTGRNLPCANKAAANELIRYDNKYTLTDYIRSILNMGSLCNFEVTNDTAEDIMRLETVVQLNEHSLILPISSHWLSAGVMFSEKKMWVGQVAVKPQDNSGLESVIPPYIEVFQNSSATTPVGYAAVYTLYIKTGPNTNAKYTFTVTTASTMLTICNVRVLAKGRNLPCVREDVKCVLRQDSSGNNDKADLDLGMVSNTGTGTIVSNTVFDDETLQMEVIVQLSKAAPDASDHNFDIVTKHGTATVTKTVKVTATTDLSGINDTVTADPTLEMGVLPITDTDNSSDVNKGQAKRIFLDITVPLKTTQSLNAKILAPINMASVVEIRYIGLLSKGANLPCLDRNHVEADYKNRTSQDPSKWAIAVLDMGYVCNIGMDTTDPEANKIRVEAVVRVLKNDTLTPGTKITLSGTLSVNNQQIRVTQHDLNIVDSFTDILPENMTLLNNTAIKVNTTEDPLEFKINEERTIPINLIIPPYLTANVRFDVDLPVNDSAVMIFKKLEVTGSGKNLAGYGFQENEITIQESSSKSTTQMNKMYGDLGIVTNAGISHRFDEDVYEDDVIRMDLTVAMADSAINDPDSLHYLSVGLKIGVYIVILEYQVKVVRDGSEKPCIEFTGTVDTGSSSATSILIKGLLKHTNESSAESTMLEAFLLFPPFLEFDSYLSQNDSRIPCTESNTTNLMKLECSSFYFTDVLAFSVRLRQKSGYEVPTSVQGTDTVISLATASKMHMRLGNSHGGQVEFSCNMNFLNHTVSVTQKMAVSCTVQSMELGDPAKIQDCQISGSADYYAGGEPTQGRIGGTGFSPFVRKGNLKKQRYFQVYLGSITTVKKIKVGEGTGGPFGSQVTKIQPYFSNDGYGWMAGGEITLPGGAFPKEVDVSNSVNARYIRVYILEDTDDTKKIGVTFDLLGCYLKNDVSGAALCAGVKDEVMSNTDWYPSGFLNDGSNLFVCDRNNDGQMSGSCYKSTDGDNWENLDKSVDCMLGHEPNSGEHFALGKDGSYLSSTDDGKTWATIRKERWTTVQSEASLKTPQKVPWKENAALDGADPDASFQDGNWGATWAGIQKKNGATWAVRFNWASCCNK